jgi:hypothetical protein
MNKIPTAEDFLLSYGIGHDKELLPADYFDVLATKVLPELIKLYVKDALKAASESSRFGYEADRGRLYLDVYPLDNIK